MNESHSELVDTIQQGIAPVRPGTFVDSEMLSDEKREALAALQRLIGQVDALNAENAKLNVENRDLLEKWSARGDRIDSLVETLRPRELA